MKISHKYIVIVTSEFPPLPGGIGNHAYHLALFLSKHSYNVEVIADQRSLDLKTELEFDQKVPFVVKRIKLRNPRIFMYFDRVFKTYKSIKRSDLVIATGKFSLWNVACCTLFLKRPSLAVIHGSEVNFRSLGLRTAVNWALKRFTEVIAVSNYTKGLVSHLGNRIIVIPNGIDFDAWKAEGVEPMALTGSPVLTTVGRVSSRKGQLEVIKLLPKLLDDFPDMHYHCIGIPTEADAFKAVAVSLGVDSHVSFHGAVSNNYLKAVLLSTDVFVMMSTESSTGDVEGFGIAILEANALGIPAIGSKNCGIEDAIKPGYSGFLINKNDTTALIDCIDNILNGMEDFKLNSMLWAKEHDWEIIVKHYIKVISCLH